MTIGTHLIPPLAGVMLPIFGILLLLGAVAGVMQVGLLFLPERLMPDITRLDPLQGFAPDLFVGRRRSPELWAGESPDYFFGGLDGFARRRDRILGLAPLELPQIGAILARDRVLDFDQDRHRLFLLAVFDYGFQWWKQEQDLRMTTQEVREEMKNLQGDPQMIARRCCAAAIDPAPLLGRVPKADVVITNPTELAVAIQYDPKPCRLRWLWPSAGILAQRIRRLALEHGIPVVEKKPLAQAGIIKMWI